MVSYWHFLNETIAKRDGRSKCLVCQMIIKKGERRMYMYNDTYFPVHLECFLYMIVMKYPEIKKITKKQIHEFEKKMIVGRI